MSLINTLIENIVFPSLCSKGPQVVPNLSVSVFIYWRYVLCASGTLIAEPLTMPVKIMIESFEETKLIARLMDLLED